MSPRPVGYGTDSHSVIAAGWINELSGSEIILCDAEAPTTLVLPETDYHSASGPNHRIRSHHIYPLHCSVVRYGTVEPRRAESVWFLSESTITVGNSDRPPIGLVAAESGVEWRPDEPVSCVQIDVWHDASATDAQAAWLTRTVMVDVLFSPLRANNAIFNEIILYVKQWHCKRMSNVF